MDHTWRRGHVLGYGSTSTVSLATIHQSDGGFVLAVKSAELENSELLRKEQRILSTLKCPQIVEYKGFDVTNEHGTLLYNLFLEYAADGTVIDVIRKHGGWLDEGMIKSYARDILLGLQHLHSKGIAHCDIKGHNILVTSNGAKIADFGCAKRVNELSAAGQNSKTPIAGTPVYMAPEVARGEDQRFAADIWAFGCTVIEMATGRAPWGNVQDPVTALYQIGYSGKIPEIPSFMSKQAKDFVNKCLKMDPMERCSAVELLKHAFITEEPRTSVFQMATTPTSVLDQGLWDSTDEEIWKSTCKTGSFSPMERIRQLAARSNVETAEWESENGAWITVRCKDCSDIEESELEYKNEANWIDIVWVSGEHNLSNIICNKASGRCTLYTDNSSSCKDNILFMFCICTKDDVFGSFCFDTAISMLCSTPQFFHNLINFLRIFHIIGHKRGSIANRELAFL